MKNALRVFRRDLKGMIKNPIAILIIAGICIIPSLYAWINIKACWDPYTNTQQVPIAVVNIDKGATIAGKEINVGNSIVEQLNKNRVLNWQFVSPEQAKIGLASGEYYAELEIPSNFSSNLATLTSDKPVKPELIYRVNTKLGPVANKITEVAQQNLLNQIKSSVMSTISQQLFTVLNTFGEKAAKNKNEIIALKEGIINLNTNMGTVTSALDNVGSSSQSLTSYLNTIKTTIPELTNGLNQVQTNTSNIASIASSTKNLLNTSLNNVQLNLTQAQGTLNNVSDLIGQLKGNVDTAQATSLLNRISSDINSMDNGVTANINFLNSVGQSTGNASVAGLVNQLKDVQGALNHEKDVVSAAQNSVSKGGTLASSTLGSLQSATSSATNNIGTAINNYNNNVKGNLNTISNGLISATNDATQLISQTQGLGQKIENVIGSASEGSQLAGTAATQLSNDLNQYKDLISQLSNKLSALSDNNINQMISVLQGNPMLMGDFISSPFNFKQESIYPVANYGSGMTPVYSVLAFWVGVLLLTSLLKTESAYFEGIEKMTSREKHFGKMLTFVFLGFIQALIIALGDKFLLGVQTVNLPLFMGISILTGIVFAIIIFTIVSLFRTMGKAVCIVLMVVQLSGTGGTYPIQALPKIFRMLKPFLPFPYGIDGMREAIGGPYWPNTITDIVILIVFGLIFVLLGYFLKPRTEGFFTKFEEKFEESGVAE